MKNFDEILAVVARQNGTTPENVLHEMQLAIDDAYDHHGKESQPVAAERHCRKTDGAVCRRQPRLFGASRIGLRSGRRPLLGEIKPLHHPGQFVPYGHQ